MQLPAGRPRMTKVRLTLTALSLSIGPAHAQLPTETPQCYQFDRQYFHWVGRRPGGGPLFDSTSVVMLSPESHLPHLLISSERRARVLVPPTMRADSSTMRSWLGPSHWRSVLPDSVEIVWRNGFYGPVFRMQVRADTLRGRVRFTTDVVGAEPPPEDAAAVRILCPSDQGVPPSINFEVQQ